MWDCNEMGCCYVTISPPSLGLLEVDAVSGATGSSTAVRKAVELALVKGVVPGRPATTVDTGGVKGAGDAASEENAE